MKKTFWSVTCLLQLLIFPVGMWAVSPTAGSIEHIFGVSAKLACTQRAVPAECEVLQLSQEDLGHNVVYYRALIKLGTGDHDVIALSRIVRETRGVPVHTLGSFFFIHGSSETFNQVMVMPRQQSGLGVFLANRNIDVWGIDLRNVQIAADVTDLSFGRDWGYDVQIKDVLVGTRTARWVRAMTGQGSGAMILGGHSSGAALTYAVVNAEAVFESANRDVAGIIPMEMFYVLPPWATDQSDFSCAVEAMYRDYVDSYGIFFFDNFASIEMAKLAQTDPNGLSPYQTPLTNLQYAMESAGALFFWPLYPMHPWAIVRDTSGTAVAGRYSPTSEILENFATSPTYAISNAMSADEFGLSCPTTSSPYAQNLGAVQVPVLYIGAAGGMGELGEYTMNALGSKDVTKIMIRLRPADDATNDFGHMDAFTADKAPQLVWHPMHAWILAHSH
jgi:hypothetical protein